LTRIIPDVTIITITGRPLGSENFVVTLEKILDRMLRPQKAGTKAPKKVAKDCLGKMEIGMVSPDIDRAVLYI